MTEKEYSFGTEPSQLVFRVSAPLSAGKYTWTPRLKVAAIPQVDLQSVYLYKIYAYSFSADIDELDYQVAIDIGGDKVPQFRLYVDSDAKAPILRQPLALANYYTDVDYRKWRKFRSASGVKTQSQINQMRGSFDGTLNHLPSMIGKLEINLILTLFIQEIRDDQLIRELQSEYGGKVPPKRKDRQ
jgi:hypothetical protein